MLGTRRADLVTILVNPLHTTRELHHQLVDFGATTLILPDNFAAVPAAKVRPAAFAGVNTLYDALLNAADFAKLDLSHLKLCLYGGTALRSGTAERWKALTGKNVVEGYGLSETSAAITFNRPDSANPVGSIGVAMADAEISLRDSDGKRVDIGETGELCARGPHITSGYWRRPWRTPSLRGRHVG